MSIKDLGHRIYDILTKPKVVKYSTFVGLGIFIGAIVIGFFVAQFDPDGYNMVNNYISDMGSFNHTPLPYFLDYGNMISAFLLVPCTFYLEKELAPDLPPAEYFSDFSRMRMRLSSYGVVSMLFGLLGLFGTGLFSEDRSTIYDLHWLFTIVVFVGFAMTSFFYGLLLLFYDTYIPKLMGLYMVIAPPIMAVILFSYGFYPIHEWMMLFFLLGWILPISYLSLKRINKELEIK